MRNRTNQLDHPASLCPLIPNYSPIPIGDQPDDLVRRGVGGEWRRYGFGRMRKGRMWREDVEGV
eukprot:6981293-Pyramimonas_sp.AAC.1